MQKGAAERCEKAPAIRWKHCVLHFAGAPAAFLYQEYTRESGFTFHMNASVNFHRQLLKLLNAYTEISPYREVQVSTLLTSLLLSIITTSDAYRHAQQAMPGQIKDIVYRLPLSSELLMRITFTDCSKSTSAFRHTSTARADEKNARDRLWPHALFIFSIPIHAPEQNSAERREDRGHII